MKDVTAVLLFLCLSFCNALMAQSTQEMSPKQFREYVAKTPDVVILDVRTAEEYEEGHLSSAVNINVLDDSFENAIDTLDRNKTYLLYCKTGKRSETARRKMKANNFTRLINLKGGIVEWKKKGMPVVKK